MLVVCGRTPDVHTVEKKLDLDHAVELLQPTDEQVKRYLNHIDIPLWAVEVILAYGHADVSFMRSPFVLDVIASMYETDKEKANELLREMSELASQDSRAWWNLLFDYYTENRFEWGRYTEDGKDERESLKHRLAWLARTLREHSEPILYLAYMQPSWLSSRMLRCLVVPGVAIVCGIGVGLLCGLVDGLIIFWISEPVRSMPVAIRNGFVVGALVGLFAGIVAGWQSHDHEIEPLAPVRVAWSWLNAT